MNEQMMAKSKQWKKIGIGAAVIAVLAAAISLFSFHKAAVYHDAAMSAATPGDAVEAQVKTAPRGEAATEAGLWTVAQVRPCQDGMKDVSLLKKINFDAGECGTVYDTAHNFLADQGEADILACFYQGVSCPTGFTASLLDTSAAPTEASTWASLSSNELTNGVSTVCPTTGCGGYASWSIGHSNTGWFGTTSGTAPTTVATGSGGCTESGSTCAQVSTAQQTITATANWTTRVSSANTACGSSTEGACFIVIRATGTDRLISVAGLSTGRKLQNGDQLNLTYRQAMQ